VLKEWTPEFEEETGWYIHDLLLCGILSIDATRESGICVFIFKGEMHDVVGSPESLRPSEEGNLEWIDLADIYEKPLVEDLYILLPKVFSMNTIVSNAPTYVLLNKWWNRHLTPCRLTPKVL